MTNRGIADALERLQRAVEADDPHEIIDVITAEKWWLLPNHFPAMKAALAHVPASMIAEHPLLQQLRPLPLIDGRAELGGLTVRLDPELGVVYEKSSPSILEAT